MKIIRLEKDRLISEDQQWELTNVLGMTFTMDFNSTSKFSFSVKKPDAVHSFLYDFCVFILKLAVVILGVVLVAKYSVLVAIILGIFLMKMIIPWYWNQYKKCHSSGIITYYFVDVVEFVKFQKLINDDKRGNKLIKHGFVLGKRMEEIFYVFFPPLIYNSDRFRVYLKYFVKVIYPVFIILLPMVISLCYSLAKSSKYIYKALKKDYFINFIMFVGEEGAEFIEDQANDYKLTKIIWEKLELIFDYLEIAIIAVMNFLSQEILLVFLKIEYFYNCYVKIGNSSMKLMKFWARQLKRIGFGWIVKPIEAGAKRFTSAVNTIQIADELKDEASNVLNALDKKNS